MCELFAINARKPLVINDYLGEFFSHSVNHPHGWGIALLDGEQARIEKEPVPAHDSTRVKALLDAPVSTARCMAHIRKATCGDLAPENCHPFSGVDATGRAWVMEHNGVMFDETLLARYRDKEQGDTDSERILLYMLDALRAAAAQNHGELDEDAVFDVLAQMVVTLSPDNKLNLILDDGLCTYIHTNTTTPTLHMLVEEDRVVISTQPLGPGDWVEVPPRRLIALRAGEVVATSPEHNHGFDNQILIDWLAEQGIE